jgi:hypothetical protein
MRAVGAHRHRGPRSVSCQRLWFGATLARCRHSAACTARARSVVQRNVAQRLEQAATTARSRVRCPPLQRPDESLLVRAERPGVRVPLWCQQHLHRGTQVPQPKRPGDSYRSACHALCVDARREPGPTRSAVEEAFAQGGASDDDRALVGEGLVERDARAAGAGWLRTYSKIAAPGWARSGIGRVKEEGERP